MIRLLIPFLFIASTHTASSQYDKILGAQGIDWHDPMAWFPAGLPTSSDSVLVTGGYCFISPDSIARALHVTISQDTEFEIMRDLANNKPGRLIIENAPDIAFMNYGLLTNGGRITIRESALSGIVNMDRVITLEKSKIVVDSITTGAGIENFGYFENDGNLDLAHINGRGFDNRDTLINMANGLIGISHTHTIAGTALYNEEAYLLNQGKVAIDRISFYGIFGGDNSSLINDDTISINHVSNFGVYYDGSFVNSAQGFISVNNVVGQSNPGVLFGQNDDEFIENHGYIRIDTIESTGLYSSRKIVNSGVLEIRNTGEEGVVMYDSLLNQSTGQLLIADYGDNALVNRVVMINSGEMWVDSNSTSNAIFNTGVLVNEESAKIFSYGEVFNYFGTIENDGHLYVLGISDQSNLGVNNNGKIINRDSIFIYNTSLGMANDDTLHNTPTGYIFIENQGSFSLAALGNEDYLWNEGEIQINIEGISSFEGIQNYMGSYLLNDGLLHLTNISALNSKNSDWLSPDNLEKSSVYVLGLYNEGMVTNNGDFTIDNFERGINNIGPNSEDYISTAGELYNYGNIRCTNSITYGLQNGGVFISSEGSEFLLDNYVEEYPILDILLGGTFEILGELDVLADGR